MQFQFLTSGGRWWIVNWGWLEGAWLLCGDNLAPAPAPAPAPEDRAPVKTKTWNFNEDIQLYM